MEWCELLPLVRRIFGELKLGIRFCSTNELLGLIFYLDFKYGKAQTDLHTNNSDVYGNTSGSNVDGSGGLYGW